MYMCVYVARMFPNASNWYPLTYGPPRCYTYTPATRNLAQTSRKLPVSARTNEQETGKVQKKETHSKRKRERARARAIPWKGKIDSAHARARLQYQKKERKTTRKRNRCMTARRERE